MKKFPPDKDGRPLKILMLGYLPPPVGGVRVLFHQLVGEIGKVPGIHVKVIPLTGRSRGTLSRAAGLAAAGWRVLFNLPTCDLVSLQPTNTALAVLGPWIFLWSRILRRPLLVRKFGGGFTEIYGRWPRLLRFLLRHTVFRAELCLFETASQCRAFAPICRRVERFPNSRPVPPDPAPPPASPPFRLLFIGHIRGIKGVESVYRLAAALPPEAFSCHLYGPMGFDITPAMMSEWESESPARYGGVLTREMVFRTMESSHLLLMPADPAPGTAVEGHPGVILEALALGLPVAATRVGGIGEILDASCGILVDPGDETGLLEAIRVLAEDPEHYQRLRHGARARAASYDSEKWTRTFISFCRELIRDR